VADGNKKPESILIGQRYNRRGAQGTIARPDSSSTAAISRGPSDRTLIPVISEKHPVHDEPGAWFVRPIILFGASYIILLTLHESAHALTAYAFHVPFTLFHFGADVELDHATLIEQAGIRVAGPLCSLLAGLVCWFLYRRSRSELMLLYLATFGVGTFFGNLMSTAFVGDFSNIALALHLPMTARYTVSLMGFLLIGGLHFMVGWELRRLSPVGSRRLSAMMVMVVIPVVAGTAIVTLSSLPMPSALIIGRLSEVSFWIFSVVGVLVSGNTPAGDDHTLRWRWFDVVILAVAIIATRILAIGIPFQP
jgi:hypothetical protein